MAKQQHVDPVFGEDPPESEPTPIPKAAPKAAQLFEATPEEKAKEEHRLQDRQIALLIGQKSLERLRAFGYDVLLVNADRMPLTPGINHAGMTGQGA